MDCEHGWRNAMDCDTCTAIRVAPRAMDQIAELEDALLGKRRTITELKAALRDLVDAVKAGEAVSGAEAVGAAEALLQKLNS